MKQHIKCIVKDCLNHQDQGSFVGELCSPCWEFVTKGTGKHSQVWRNTVKSERDSLLAFACDLEKSSQKQLNSDLNPLPYRFIEGNIEAYRKIISELMT